MRPPRDPLGEMTVPSRSRANKAGDRLRRMYAGSGLLDPTHDAEMEVLAGWRAQFGAPMAKTSMTLRSAIRTVTGVPVAPGVVSQRHKREQQIIAKLIRARTRLSTMEDIAGCRAVLPDLNTVYKVRNRICDWATTLDVVSEDDYNLSPRPGGYRALHLHATRDGVPVEVQLRTQRQHQWADSVETWDGATGHDIKHESGPVEIVEAWRHAAELLSAQDHGEAKTLWATLHRERAVRLLREWLEEARRS